MAIYFIQCGEGGPIKIGFSENVNQRLISIQLNNPIRLVLLCIVDGSKIEEKRYHQLYKNYNIIGEWFEPCDELLDFISKQQYLGYVAVRGRKLEKNSCWKGTEATESSKRQRTVRLFGLKDCEICGKPGTDRHHKNKDLDSTSESNIMILCRKCCMEKDGRLAAFKIHAAKAKDSMRKPPRFCKICQELKKHHSNGRCKNCYEFLRRTGRERF